MSLNKIERGIVNGIDFIGKILAIIGLISFLFVFLIAYSTGDIEYYIEWFVYWLVDNLIFGIYILIIALFIGIISPKIAKSLRKMGGF